MRAAFDGHIVRVITLLSEGADPNARDSGGDTALMFAAMGGHLLVAKTLLGHGADPLVRARNGWQALHFAASRGHTEVASLLRQAEDKRYREGMPILKAVIEGLTGSASPGEEEGGNNETDRNETDRTGRDTGHLSRGRHTAGDGARHTCGAIHDAAEG